MRNITASIISKARGWLGFLSSHGSHVQVGTVPAPPSAPSNAGVQVDRPADHLISDRIQAFAGWTSGLEDQQLSAVCQGREMALIRFPYPSLENAGLHGFGTYFLAQDLLSSTPEPYVNVEILASHRIVARVPLRLSPLVRELARDFPLSTKRYPVLNRSAGQKAENSQPAGNEPPVVVFPGVASVGGCSLNLLIRLEMIRRGWGFPMYWEANDEDLWRRLCARSQPDLRWIDGHACYRSGEALRRPSVRVTLLRDPVKRAISFYNYAVVVHPYDFPYPTFDDFLESGAARHHSQCQILLRFAGAGDTDRLGNLELYRQAKAELNRSYCLVGITEYFEETVFLIAELLGLKDVGMWSRVLASPKTIELDRLSAEQRRRLESQVQADLLLYHDQKLLFEELLGKKDFGDPLRAYKQDAAGEKHLPDHLKMVECLRWRQVLAEEELLALRPHHRKPELI